MTDHLYIDKADRKRIVTRWVVITLVSLHAWASVLVLAAVMSPQPSDILAPMFSTVCFGIGMTIAILLVDRASDILIARFAMPAPAKVEETLSRTVTTTPTEGAPAP